MGTNKYCKTQPAHGQAIAEKLQKITSFPFRNCRHSIDNIDCHFEYSIEKKAMCVWLKPLCLHRIHIINYWFGHCSFRFVEYCGRFSRSYCDCFMLRAPTNQNKSRKQQERRATQRCMCTNRVDDNTHGGAVIEPKRMRQQKQMINWIKTNKQKKFRLWRATKARRARAHTHTTTKECKQTKW